MKEVVAAAEKFIDHLASGRVREAYDLLDAGTQATGAAVKLQDTWRGLMTRYGQLVKRTTEASHPQLGWLVVYFSLEFQRASLPGFAVCSPAGKVGSFAFGTEAQLKYMQILREPQPASKPPPPPAKKKA